MARHIMIKGCWHCPNRVNKDYCKLSRKPIIEEEYLKKFPDHCRLPKIKQHD